MIPIIPGYNVRPLLVTLSQAAVGTTLFIECKKLQLNHIWWIKSVSMFSPTGSGQNTALILRKDGYDFWLSDAPSWSTTGKLFSHEIILPPYSDFQIYTYTITAAERYYVTITGFDFYPTTKV